MATAAASPVVLRSRPPRGGRGLKYTDNAEDVEDDTSSSSRRTWIEIRRRCGAVEVYPVVLLAEDVD